MDGAFAEALRARYAAYVDGYRGPDGALPPMMELKREHVLRVVGNAREIAAGEGFDARTALVCETAALLHDAGRFEQLRRYGTFRDSESVDHAELSRDVVRERGWLDGFADRDAALAAILHHNRRDLPAGLDPLALAASRTVRDADKLDIFRVLESQVASADWRTDSAAFWNLPADAPPNPAVIAAILAGETVDYRDVRSLADFVLVQVGWIVSGLAYGTTRRLCAERGHAAFRRRFLRQLTDDPGVDGVFAALDAAGGGEAGAAHR